MEDCVRGESKSLHGFLREITEWMLQAALKEKVIVKKESLQDYERRRKDEKVKNWKLKALHGTFVQQYQMKLERSLGDGSGMDS